MKQQDEQGKVTPRVFEQLIQPHLGRPTDKLLVGPAAGVDVSVLDIERGQVLISTTDPIAIDPPLGMELSAWLALHVIASDLATAGVAPQYISVNFSLPTDFPEADFESFWLAFHSECDSLGISIVGGHTGRYEGCALPMVGSGTAFAVASKDGYVTSRMAKPGDKIVLTKQPGLEAAVMLAFAAPTRARELLGNNGLTDLQARFKQLSVVHDASVATSIGLHGTGVSSMHDVTEGGLIGGLLELSEACGAGFEIELSSLPEDEAVSTILAEHTVQPLMTVSEGCLLVTVHPEGEELLREAFRKAGIDSSTIGELLPDSTVHKVLDHGSEVPVQDYRGDHYWEAYFRAMESEAMRNR